MEESAHRIDLVKSVRPFFWNVLQNVLVRSGINLAPGVSAADLESRSFFGIEGYLLDLLEEFMSRASEAGLLLSKPLLPELLQNCGGDLLERRKKLRFVGDAALFTAGILGPYLTRSSVGVNYYADISRSAYELLFLHFTEPPHFAAVYKSFSEDLRPAIRVLNEVSTEEIFRTRLSDILDIYVKYMKTGCEGYAELLKRHLVMFEKSESIIV